MTMIPGKLSLRLWPLLLAFLAVLVPAASAGTFSINAWTNDASSGIVSGQTLWAYHFGDTNTAVVNGVTVPGTGTNGNPSVAGQFNVAGIPFVFPDHPNNLTAQFGTGSAVMGRSFIFGGAPGLITVQGLTTGQVYTVSVYGVGFDAPDTRASNFTNGSDRIYVDENSLGSGAGMRVDYTFKATATTNLTIVMPTNTSTFHTYGLALRQPLRVTTTSNAGPGSLRQAVVDAATLPGTNTITFAPALSGAIIPLGSQIIITNSVTIDASSLPGGIAISGNAATRIFYVSNGAFATLKSLTLTNGLAPTGNLSVNGGGGGIFCRGRVDLLNCSIINNTVATSAISFAGGIACDGGEVRFTACTLTGNSATVEGGAIYNSSGTVTLMQCTLAGNFTGQDGGAILNRSGTMALTQCTLSGNSATNDGGAIYLYDNAATMILTHCTLSGNSAGRFGGAIENHGTAALMHCTISDNQARGGGGVDTDTGSLNLTNCIVAGNTADSGADIQNQDATFIRGGANIVQDIRNVEGVTESGPVAINADPLLAPLGNYGGLTQTMPPSHDSPAIDAAAAIGLFTDQRGLLRTSGTAPDIGAVELQQLFVNTTGDEGDGILVPPISLREALTDPNAAGFELIRFAPSLNGQTLTLISEIIISNSAPVDATTLPAGLTISGDNATRLFYVPFGQSVSLAGLTLSGGNGVGTNNSNAGGAIANEGNLSLTRCTLSDNYANDEGGAIMSISATLTLKLCTLSGNAAYYGGALGNSDSTVTLTHCTLSENFCTGGGGGLDTYNNGIINLTACILARNEAFFNVGPDLWLEDGTIAATNCLIGNGKDSTLAHGVNGNLVGTSSSPLEALLAALGNYGGSTPTRPPMVGSPAIDATTNIAGITADQRGFLVSFDPAYPPDIGAVELQQVFVTTLADQSNGINAGGVSLREAITDTSNGIYELVRFNPDFSGQTLTLSREIVVARNVAVDASSLPAGLTVDGGPGLNRHFTVNVGRSVAFHGLMFTGGNGAGNFDAGLGGSIYNLGKLTLTRCTFSGNSAYDSGGAIYSSTDQPENFIHLTHCTVAGNAATNRAGGVFNGFGRMILTHCTITSNTAPAGTGGGVASLALNSITETLVQNTIIAGNANSDVALAFGVVNTFASSGFNLIGTGNATGNFMEFGDITNNLVPLLAPLANYGGATRTMPPLPDSPAVDAGVNFGSFTTDQRGYPLPVSVVPDIGAVEGIYNAAGPGKITSITRLGNGSVRFSFTNLTDASFPVVATTNLSQSLSNWSVIGYVTETAAGTGLIQFTDPQSPNYPQRFYRVKSP